MKKIQTEKCIFELDENFLYDFLNFQMEKRHHAYLGYIIFQLFLSIALIVVVLIPATDLWPESFTEIDWGWGTSLLSVAGYFLAILTLILHRRSEKAGEFV